jgi:hypothetical protein
MFLLNQHKSNNGSLITNTPTQQSKQESNISSSSNEYLVIPFVEDIAYLNDSSKANERNEQEIGIVKIPNFKSKRNIPIGMKWTLDNQLVIFNYSEKESNQNLGSEIHFVKWIPQTDLEDVQMRQVMIAEFYFTIFVFVSLFCCYFYFLFYCILLFYYFYFIFIILVHCRKSCLFYKYPNRNKYFFKGKSELSTCSFDHFRHKSILQSITKK